MRSPDNSHDIEQASDLCFGKIGKHEGLWTVCDRNGGNSAGKIYFFSADRLKEAEPAKPIIAGAEITIVAPTCDWTKFCKDNHAAGENVLDDLKRRIIADADRSDEPYLDLEAITIAPSISPPHKPHLFVVAEEPYSSVLELNLEGEGPTTKAHLVAIYAYNEPADQQGTANNDGLEGLAYAGKPGEFFFVEEGTHSHTENVKPLMMFRNPLLGQAKLENGRIKTEEEKNAALSQAVQAQRQGPMQTLNAVTVLNDGYILAVDRNGGWILRFSLEKYEPVRWLNLYDLNGVNLRELLAKFPMERQMPYISIEGIAADSTNNLWLVDDPAMPETSHESCLIRIQGLNFTESRPSTKPN